MSLPQPLVAPVERNRFGGDVQCRCKRPGRESTDPYLPVASTMRPSLRLLTRDNGVGLSRDLRLLAHGLAEAGWASETVGFGTGGRSGLMGEAGLWARRMLHGRIDTQIFIERVYHRCLPLARRNLLLPNPEWLLDKWRPLLPRFERVLCKTQHAQQIFEALGCRTAYVGFTSDDRLDPAVPRVAEFFHLAGASSAKGTEILLAAWRKHPEWPKLTVVQAARHARPCAAAANIDHRIGYIDDAGLRELQNRCLFHVCPSEVEGFGHYLVEAMSVGAVVLATDAAPMNEHVTAGRGLLIASSPGRTQGLVVRRRIEVEAIEDAVVRTLALDPQAISVLCAAARTHYLEARRSFHLHLGEAMQCLFNGGAALGARASDLPRPT
jgi:glycosyltransferase involved in cell wall biosynthesis